MTFSALITQIKKEQGLDHEVPGFDPQNGNELARYLFLLEAPGPRAVQTGYVSLNNPDPTARNFRSQLSRASITSDEIAVWNVVPWYLGDEGRSKIRGAQSSDIRKGCPYLGELIDSMPMLDCIVLVGSAARKAHVFLSQTTTARILSCHHPSAQAMNANPAADQENVAVLQFMKHTTIIKKSAGAAKGILSGVNVDQGVSDEGSRQSSLDK